MQKIKVKQIRSVIDRPLRQKRTIEALGLGRPNWVKIHNDTPQIRGMVNKISHLVEVSDYVPTGEEKEKPAVKKKSSVKKTASTEKTKKTSAKAKKEIKSK
ncbi:MAG: 50S ribosomal protein L30 [Ignavibacteriales bacterium]|nr:MAG: 50S ribosomal protein L30 [Ignavibacteriales bacterium]